MSGQEAEFEVPRPASIPDSARSEFTAWLRELARSHTMAVVEQPPSATIRSFDSYLFRDQLGEELWVLFSTAYNVVGFTPVEPKPGAAMAVDSTYVDVSIPEGCAGWGPTIVDAAVLSGRISEWQLRNLSAADRKDIEYWKPTKVAHLLFNYWD